MTADNFTEVDTWTISLTGKIITSVAFGSVILVGIIGNVLVLVLLILVQKLHSVVNLCLGALALTDLMVLVFMPILAWKTLYGTDDSFLGKNFCIFLVSIDRSAATCSVLIFLLISVERYTVLVNPLRSIGMWTYKRVVCLLLVIWVLGIGVAVSYGYVARYEEYRYGNRTYGYCYLTNAVPWLPGYETAVFCVTFFLPIPILIALYGRIIVALREQITQGEAQGPGAISAKKSRAQVTRMLIVLITIFLICLLPIKLVLMVYWHDYDLILALDKRSYFILVWASRIVMYVNHASNPIVYFWMSDNFRNGFKALFCKKCFNSEPPISRVSHTQLSSI